MRASLLSFRLIRRSLTISLLGSTERKNEGSLGKSEFTTVAVTIFNSNLVGTASATSSSTSSTQGTRFRGAESITPTSSVQSSSDAAEVELSSAEQAEQRSSSTALSQLSEASSYVSIAQSAADSIDSLLNDFESTLTAIDQSVNDDDRAALASEARTILTEIGNVSAQATFNGTSVVNAGTTDVSIELDGGDDSSASNYTVSISNIALSRDDLGISGLTSSDFLNNTEALLEDGGVVDEAQSRVGAVQSRLSEAENQIQSVGTAVGIGARDEVEAIENADGSSESPEALTDRIVQNLDSTLNEVRDDIDPVQVQELLIESEEAADSAEESNSDDIRSRFGENETLAQVRAENEIERELGS